MNNKYYEKIKEYIKHNLTFLLFLTVLITVFNIDTNYIIYKTGGSINITKRINKANNIDSTKGSFNMAYVGMLHGKLPFYLMGKIIPSWEVAPKEEIKLGSNETIEDVLKRDNLYFKESINNAKYVAYQKSGIDYTIDKVTHYIIYVDEKSTAKINIGAEIISYDDILFENIDNLKEYINKKEVNEEIIIKYKFKNKVHNTKAKIYKEDEDLFIGLASISIYDIKSDTKIKVDSKASESGPSGGLLLSLAIYEALTNEDLTKGNTIVGTGTINIDGQVEEISGIKFKLDGAVRKKADLFLVPKENLKEALKYAKKKNYNINIKGVSSFDEAIEILKNMEVKK